ncbi:hypothetical protein D3C85_1576800 [compost metagenome]
MYLRVNTLRFFKSNSGEISLISFTAKNKFLKFVACSNPFRLVIPCQVVGPNVTNLSMSACVKGDSSLLSFSRITLSKAGSSILTTLLPSATTVSGKMKEKINIKLTNILMTSDCFSTK